MCTCVCVCLRMAYANVSTWCKLHSQGCAPVLLLPRFPAVGASNLGHIILYSVLNQQEGLLCDRAYYPADDMQVAQCLPCLAAAASASWQA